MFGWLFGGKRKKPSGPEPERAAHAAPAAKQAPAPAAPAAPAAKAPAAEAARGRTADDVLRELEEGKVSPEEPAEEAAPEAPIDPNLARHLLAEGPITREFIQQQLTVSGKADSYLGQILTRVRAPNEAKLYRLLAAGYDVPQVDLKQCKIPMTVARSVPPDTLRKYKMLPLEQIGDLLCVAFSGEPNPKATEAIRKATGLRVKALRCPPHHVEILLRRLLREVAVAQIVAAVAISEADYEEAVRGPEQRWESIHASRGPLRATRIA